MARTASKSPARGRRQAAAAAAPSDDGSDQTQFAIAMVVVAFALFQATTKNGCSLESVANGFRDLNVNVGQYTKGITVVENLVDTVFGFLPGTDGVDLVLGLHFLNTVNNNLGASGYWLANFMAVLVAAFAGQIAPAVLSGKGVVESVFQTHNGHDLKFWFVLWYICNYDIPGCPAKFGVWDKVKEFGGEALDTLMGFASMMFNLKLVLGCCKGEELTLLSNGWFAAMVGVAVVANANNFFPLSKGFSLKESADAAFIAFFVCGGGFAVIDELVGVGASMVKTFTLGHGDEIANTINGFGIGGKVNGAVVDHFGGAANFVVFVVAMNHLVGKFSPVPLGNGFDVFNVGPMVSEFFQL